MSLTTNLGGGIELRTSTTPARRLHRLVRRGVLGLFLAGALLAISTSGTLAAEPHRYIYPPPESENDHRLDYYWGLLRASLEATRSSHGGYQMTPHSEIMNAARVMASLQNPSSLAVPLTVAMFNGSAEREKVLLPVRIPLDKGLTGYRLFLTKQATQAKLNNVRTVEDLKAFRFGQGAKWVDTEILRAAGLTVEGSTNYEGLFLMLAADRFDLFPRGVNEIAAELTNYRATIPDLGIEKKLLLYYPQPRYFFFSRTPEGERLAARVEEGLQELIQTGEFELRYQKFKAQVLTFLDISGRRVIRLDNPALSPETPLKRKELWDSLSKELKAAP